MATLYTPQEKPMQTAAGRRMSSMPESVTGTNSQLAARLADASAWHAQRLHAELDYFDDVERPLGYCPACRCNVPVKRVDYGFGFDHGSVSGYYRDERDECPTCEGPVEAPRDFEEDEEA